MTSPNCGVVLTTKLLLSASIVPSGIAIALCPLVSQLYLVLVELTFVSCHSLIITKNNSCQTRQKVDQLNAMYNNQPPEDSPANSSPNSTLDRADQTPTKNPRKSLKRFTVKLLVIGLILGGLFSVGIVGLLNRWGLTDNTPRLNQIRE